MENKILNILRKYEGSYEHKIYNRSFEDIAKEISIEIKLMTAELQAKVYTYEKIIANSNFKPILQEEIESNVNDDIEFGVLKALNTNLEDDVEMGGVRDMSAKEMFEKLGYEYSGPTEFCNSICYKSTYKNLEGSWLEIIFNLDIKTIDTYMCNYDSLTKFRCNIDMKLLQAINKQVEELGWNKND